jgi:DICT domain-containing protein
MWESRYGFPDPQRLASGHRRYTEADLERVRAVVRAREEGLPLPMAIERARLLSEEARPSVFGALRASFPHLHPHVLTSPALRHISNAIEDECCARAPHPLLFACFQHERHFRDSESRWRELARTADCAIVLADFPGGGALDRRPAEVPLAEDDPMMREWVVVCDAPELSVALTAWERPRQADEPRRFEALWSVEPEVVREAARVCAELAARHAPELVAGVRERLAERAPLAGDGQLRTVVELATRVTLYATQAAV